MDREMNAYFVPVCLYPHTMYRTRDGVNTLFNKFRLCDHRYLIVVADRLLGLDRLVTGRYWSSEMVPEKARRDAVQVYKLIKRVAHQQKADSSGRICYWDEVASTSPFVEFSGRMREAFLGESKLAELLN